MRLVFIVSVNVLFLSNSQLTPIVYESITLVFIVSVNVLFLSNSQPNQTPFLLRKGVYRKCQCPLFKQFTTRGQRRHPFPRVFIVSVNVLFLSNSQPLMR